MSNQKYRVILTGELKPGFSRDAALAGLSQVFHTPADQLRALFDGGEHPVNQEMSADQALDFQSRLDSIGVVARIEKLAAQSLDLQVRPDIQAQKSSPPPEQGGALPGRNEAGRMQCPACGHEQLVSNRCNACGIVFAEYNRQQSSKAPTAGRAPAPPPTREDTHARDNWHDEWGGFDEDAPPDESGYLGLFFGEKAEQYLGICERYVSGGPRTRFALGWNWAAVPSPFVWALYRKMWAWGLLIFITEIFIPVMLITLGSYGLLDGMYVVVGYLLLVVNRLFWPAVVNFLYCRHARSSVQQLHMMSPNYATELDIATAGGVSNASVLVGLALASVMSMFLWSLVDSIHENGQQAIQQQLTESLQRSGEDLPADDTRPADDVLGIGGAKAAPQNSWVATRQRLRSLGGFVTRWMEERPGSEPSQLNMFKLRETLEIPTENMQDAWQGDIQYIPDNEGFRLISAGPDRLFGTADDIQYRRVLD